MLRPLGVVAGESGVQLDPSHFHVSLDGDPPICAPPNKMICCRCESYAIAESQRAVSEKTGPAGLFVSLLANAEGSTNNVVRLDVRVAALRAIEAIRMHAHAHDGKLPASLDEVKIVPVPHNPATGQPFAYRREGETAVLEGPMPRLPILGVSYRIAVRR